MDIHFNRANPKEAARMAPFYAMRPNKTCDSGVLDAILQRDGSAILLRSPSSVL